AVVEDKTAGRGPRPRITALDTYLSRLPEDRPRHRFRLSSGSYPVGDSSIGPASALDDDQGEVILSRAVGVPLNGLENASSKRLGRACPEGSLQPADPDLLAIC